MNHMIRTDRPVDEDRAIQFPLFEGPVNEDDRYSVKKGNLWWTAVVTFSSGHPRDGLYGVYVTARTSDGRLVAHQASAFVYPRMHHQTPDRLRLAAETVARQQEGEAMRRDREGSYLRPVRSFGGAPAPAIERPYGRAFPGLRNRSYEPGDESLNVNRRAPSYYPGTSTYGSTYGFGRPAPTPPKPRRTALDADVGALIEAEAEAIKTQPTTTKEGE